MKERAEAYRKVQARIAEILPHNHLVGLISWEQRPLDFSLTGMVSWSEDKRARVACVFLEKIACS